MAGSIKGITIEFNGDTSRLDKSLRDVDKSTKSIDGELKKVNSALKFNPTSVDLWRQKQTLLTQKISETKSKLDILKEKQKNMDAKGVDKNSKEYRELQREIVTTESKLKTFKGQLKAVGNVNLTALGAKFKEIGTKLTTVGRGLTTYVTTPLLGVGAASLKAGSDFDTAMSQVAATSGKTVKEIGELRTFAKKMGSTTAFSAKQAAEGLNFMALAGYDAKKSMKMLPTVLNLAAAGAMDLGAASDMVTDAQTALGLEIPDTIKLIDQMATTSAKSNTSVSQMGEAILKIGGNAKNLTGGTRELAQVLGLLADNGIKGSEAGTHLRNIMLALNPTTDKAKDAWNELGLSAYDADGNLKPLEETFGELREVVNDLTSEQRTQLLTAMFNKTDLASVNALLDTSAERWEELGLAIDDSAGSAAKMANTQLDNMQGSLTLLKSALEGAGIAISDVLAPYVRMLADFISGLVSKFNELDPGIQTAITVIGVLAAAIGPLLLIFGALSTAVGTILPMIGSLQTAFTMILPALGGLSLPIVAIAAGVAALATAFATAYANSEPFRIAVNDIVKTVASYFLSAIKSIVSEFKKLFNEIGAVASEIGVDLAPAMKLLSPVIKAVAKIVTGLLKRSFVLIIGVIRIFVAIVKTIVTIFKTVFTGVGKVISGAYNKIKTVFGNIKEAIVSRLTSAKERVHSIISAIKEFFNLSSIKDKVSQVFSSLKDKFITPMNSIKEKIKGIIDKIKGFFSFKVSTPHIPLPHFTVSPPGWTVGDLVKGKIPSLGIKWYAKGGIFDSPTIAGIGEAGPEAVVPLDKFWRKLEEMETGDVVVNVYGSDNMSVDELAQAVEQKIIQMQKRRRMAWQ